ncbi:zinc finger and SCAN domain-containing protein 5C-like [Poeciliopsis prolifica]|uniref:zinc finger and SCAN domain-containing protein 5C-like n=1 Tax=Poeciliopsis prolifica TaxID=188132 RepID=UPI00241465BF|nr:zinc finger and SCAN domain-containing protein 5C-like [Poeciliopsis prolifica]
MSRSQKLRLFVTQRLNAAVEEILAAFEETIMKYEEEAALSQQVISRQHALLCALDKSVMEAPAADVFTQQLLDPRDDLLLTRLDQNPDQNLLTEPSCHVEVKPEETLPALDAAEIIEFTYSSRPSARLRNGVHPVADLDPDVQVVLSSETEDSDDYSKGSPEPGSAPQERPSQHGDVFSCQACSRTFGARRFLFRHVRGHLQDPTPVCGLCGEQFEVPYGLKLHLQTHSKKKVLKNRSRTQRRARRLQQVSVAKEPEAQKEENPNQTGLKKKPRGRARSNNQEPDSQKVLKKMKRKL